MTNTCPKCQYTRTATDTAPDGECPKCGIIYARAKKTVPNNLQSSTEPDSGTTSETKYKKSPPVTPPDAASPPQKKQLIFVLILGLAVGYFGGREHLKYQMRSAITEAALEFKNSMKSMFSGGGNEQEKRTEGKRVTEKLKDLPIAATLVEKGFQEGEYGQDAITFTVSFSNDTGKNVRAFDGILEFTDLLGNEILNANLAVNDPVGAGTTLEWPGSIEYNQFVNKHRNLRNAEPQNIKIRFALQKVLFEDGTTKEY